MPSSTVSDKLFMTVLIAVVGLLKNTTFSGEEPIGKNPKRYLRLVFIYFRRIPSKCSNLRNQPLVSN